MRIITILCASILISSCSQGLVSDEKRDLSINAFCESRGLEIGTPIFQTCVLNKKQEEYEKMREAEKKVNQRLQQQKRLVEDYRNRL